MAGATDTRTSSVEDEISQLIDRYGSSLRVIRDIGDFKYVIKMDFADYGTCIKFQIEG